MSYDGQRICAVRDEMGAEQVCAFRRGNPTRIGWYLTGLLPGFDAYTAVTAYKAAWASWEAVSGIQAVYYERAADARNDLNAGKLDGIVYIGAGRIDGPNGTLAWSMLPCSTLRVEQKYDTDEGWIAHLQPGQPPSNRIDLVRVAAHELGHALGLPHLASGNLLQPTYSRSIADPQAGDTAEIVRRYGPRRSAPPRKPEFLMQKLIDLLLRLLPSGYKTYAAAAIAALIAGLKVLETQGVLVLPPNILEILMWLAGALGLVGLRHAIAKIEQ